MFSGAKLKPNVKPKVPEYYSHWITDSKSANALLQYLHHTELHAII